MKTLALILLCSAACSKTDGGKSAASADPQDPGVAFVVDHAKKDVPELKAAIAANKPSDARYSCANMANMDVLAKADPKLAAELKQLCTHDLDVAIMKVAVEQAEAARKAKPDEKVLSECFSAEFSVAADELRTYKTEDDASRALADRLAKACPK